MSNFAYLTNYFLQSEKFDISSVDCINPPLNNKFKTSKPKEFSDDNFTFDENGRKFSIRKEKTLWEKEKLLVLSNFSFYHIAFKRFVLQTHKNQGLFGKGLNMNLALAKGD